jgi:hypothetical protein
MLHNHGSHFIPHDSGERDIKSSIKPAFHLPKFTQAEISGHGADR